MDMKKLSLLILPLVLCILAGCGAKVSQARYDYKSQVLSANYDGTYVIRVHIRARNAAIAFTDAQRKAVKEVIFSGVEAASDGVKPLQPILFDMNAERKYEDYFNAFFVDGGEWTKYASLHDKRTGTTHYKRDGRQMLEVITVTVDRAGLKAKLIADKILVP